MLDGRHTGTGGGNHVTLGGPSPADSPMLRNPQVRQNYWRFVEKYRVTSISAVPTILAAIAELPTDGIDISSVRYCRTGAAILPPELARRFEDKYGLHVHEALGMTEMAGISSIRPPGVNGPAGCVEVALRAGRIEPGEDALPAVPERLAARETNRLFIVQFEGKVTEDVRRQVAGVALSYVQAALGDRVAKAGHQFLVEIQVVKGV